MYYDFLRKNIIKNNLYKITRTYKICQLRSEAESNDGYSDSDMAFSINLKLFLWV
jgi:hypothetical protein